MRFEARVPINWGRPEWLCAYEDGAPLKALQDRLCADDPAWFRNKVRFVPMTDEMVRDHKSGLSIIVRPME